MNRVLATVVAALTLFASACSDVNGGSDLSDSGGSSGGQDSSAIGADGGSAGADASQGGSDGVAPAAEGGGMIGGEGGLDAVADAIGDVALAPPDVVDRPDGATRASPCPPGPFPAPTAGPAQSVCADFQFTYNYNEGPTWIAGQNAFFFSNYEHLVNKGGDIIKYTPGGKCEIFISGVGCNGLAVTPDGDIVGACHQSRSIVRFDVVTKKATTVADSYMGQMLDTPNDLVVHSNGTIYFTDPPFELAGRPPGVGIPIFRIDPGGVLTPVAQGRPANGIAVSPDEKRLYALQGGIWDLDSVGVPSNQRPLFVGGDGMAVDCAGNLYASGQIWSAQGQRLGSYPSGTNLTFGGSDGKTLIVVGGGTQVRVIAMNVPGLP